MNDSDKHTSLLQSENNYASKKFYNTDPSVNGIKIVYVKGTYP